jgi:hypothetical protein
VARLRVYLGSSVGRRPDIHVSRQNILITGASSGLGGRDGTAVVPRWAWAQIVLLLRVVPLSMLKRFA